MKFSKRQRPSIAMTRMGTFTFTLEDMQSLHTPLYLQHCIKHRHSLAWRTGLVRLSTNRGHQCECTIERGVINELSTDSVMVRVDDWSLHRDARFELATLSMGGHRNKSDIRSTLKGSNASLKQFIAVHGHGTRHDDHHVEIHHQQPHTNSHLLLNAACDDRSHSIGTGALTIDDVAQHTDAGQIFRNSLSLHHERSHSRTRSFGERGCCRSRCCICTDQQRTIALLDESRIIEGRSNLDDC